MAKKVKTVTAWVVMCGNTVFAVEVEKSQTKKYTLCRHDKIIPIKFLLPQDK